MTPVFTIKQPEKTARLQRDIKKNLAQFRQYTVAARLDSTYWFSNEYPVGSSYSNVRLFDSFAYIPFPKPLSEYRVAILTGEGGLFRGFSVLAAKSDMTLQIDCDPLTLMFSNCLLAELRSLETFTDKNQVLEKALERFRSTNPSVTEQQEKDIRKQYEDYTVNMCNNLFTDQDEFIDFKHFQDHPVEQVCLSYFSEEAMTALAQTLRDNDAVVHFYNPSNVCEYPRYFYEVNPYRGEITGIHPAQYMLKLPFSDDAICAYSQLFGYDFFTACCPVTGMEDQLYATSINRRDRDLSKMTEGYPDPLGLYLQEAFERGQREFRPTTKLFMFFAKHTIAVKDCEWMLRLTAAKLTNEEVQELKDNRQLIETIYAESQSQLLVVARAGTPLLPLILEKILNKEIAEPVSTETDQPAKSATG